VTGFVRSTASDERRVWLLWLTRLRWVALAAQVVTLGFAWPLLDGIHLLVALGLMMSLLLFANLRAQQILRGSHPVRQTTLLWQLGLDVSVLTSFFVCGGGPDNPFILLYLVHVAMGAVMLRPDQATSLTVGVLGCYGLLHAWHHPLRYDQHALPEATLIPLGQLLAFIITTASVAIFVVGLSDTLRRRTRQLLEARDRTARIDRLRSVGTLAAGAAHELNTPLSTIGLRVRRLRRRYQDEATGNDLDAIQGQLERCSRIVQQLLAGAGDPSAVGMERARLIDLVDESVRFWRTGSVLEAQVDDRSDGVEVNLPRVAFAQALTNLLENAREAQDTLDDFTPLQVTVRATALHGIVEVRDHGCGLPQETDQVGTPFYTTKDAGTGLGVFVARQVADGAGGGLRYRRHERGTTARWWFPRAAPRRTDEPEGHPPEAPGGG
jgi:two-component system sensor histidine kinase RegB